MKTPEDKVKQAQTEMDAALAKRNRAKKLWDEAEEELIVARIKMKDAQEEILKRNYQGIQAQYERDLRKKRLS